MKQGILIITWSGGQEQFETLIGSIPVDIGYPILVVVNDGDNASWIDPYISGGLEIIKSPYDGYELGAIDLVLRNTDWDEFVVLQDTFEIKNPQIFYILLNVYAGSSISYGPYFQMYHGKFRREILEQIEFPIVKNKLEAIQHEFTFMYEYKKLDPKTICFNEYFTDSNFLDNIEVKWGRENLVLEDEYLIKRKGTWRVDHIDALAKELDMGWEYITIEAPSMEDANKVYEEKLK